jgi:hypothetical protein
MTTMLARILATLDAAVCSACDFVFPAEPGDACPRCGRVW